MFNEKLEKIYQGDISFLSNQLPCDIHLMQIRSNSHTHLEYSLFFHRLGIINQHNKCRVGRKFILGDVLSKRVLSAVEPFVTRHSLSLLEELETGSDLYEYEVSIDEMDFAVFNLQLK